MQIAGSRRPRGPRHFAKDETGAMTAFGLFMFVVSCALGGIALDIANAMRLRTHLQTAADSAAHAALVQRNHGGSENESIAAGMAVAMMSMPPGVHGNIILPADFTFGLWDEDTRTFTASAGATDAVMVDTARMANRNNGVGTYLLKFAGVGGLDVVRRSIADTFVPTCMREGFVGENYVDVTSGNRYRSGFCIHSNGYTELNNGNTYEDGVIISMPDRRDLVVPTAGWESNDGMAEALRDGYYEFSAAARVNMMALAMNDRTSPVYPSYITDHIPVNHNRRDPLDETAWQVGHIHEVTCNRGNQRLRIPNNTVLSGGAIITNCEISIGSGSALEDVTIISSSTSVDAINGSNGIRLGRDDDCADGGGTQIYTLGGMRVPSGLNIFGSRVVASGPVSFTANANGVEGVSIISDQHISATANGDMGFCNGEGLPTWFEPEFFRIVS